VNNYGIRLLMPFDGRWFYGDALFIVDPWLWLILGGAVFLLRSESPRARGAWTVLAALTSLAVIFGLPEDAWPSKLLWGAGLITWAVLRGWLGSPREPGIRQRWALGALAVAALYIGLQVASVPWARREALDALAARGVGPVEQLLVGPLPADPRVRQVVAQLPDRLEMGRLYLAGLPRLDLDPPLPRLPVTPMIEAARGAAHVQGMVTWMRFPFYVVERQPAGYRVYLLDARYTRQPTTLFGGARVDLDSALRPREPVTTIESP
jgi:inner membrane protein